MYARGIAFVCWVGMVFVSSFDVAPVSLSDKVLMHLVFPRYEVRSVELLSRKSASHLSVHDAFLLLLLEPVLMIISVNQQTRDDEDDQSTTRSDTM